MSKNKTLAIRTPVHTILRLREAQKGREDVIYRNEVLTVLGQNGKPLDEVKVRNAVSMSTSIDKICKQQMKPFIEEVSQGYNLLVMSLGATGSGKESLFGKHRSRGLISMFMQQLCMECQSTYHGSQHPNLDFFFEIRGVEIYQERVMDLFNTNLPSTCTLRQNTWQGIILQRSTTVKAQNYIDLSQKLEQALKNRQNLLNLLSGTTSRTSSFITISLVQQYKLNGKRATTCSKIMFAQLPGIQVLKDSQIDLRVREANKSIRGIVAFSSLIKQLSDDNNEVSPLYEASNLTYIMKQFLGTNAFCVAFANVTNSDPSGALKTLACMKNIIKISQYPIINTGQCLGLMYRIRTDLIGLKVPQIRERLSQKAIGDQRLMNQNSNNDRVKAQDDYKRILIKYREARTNLQQNIRKKSQLQLLLIRSQQQKLQLSKTLVQVQIQNTKLMQSAQFNEYNSARKNHKLQSALLKQQSAKTQSLQSMTQLNQHLSQLEQDKRDLQIQFIALKKNYLLSQKQLEQSRKETQVIQLDYINLTNENKYLQQQLFKGSRDQRQRYQIQQINKYHDDKREWMEKQAGYKKQIDEMRRQLLRNSKQPVAQIASSKVSAKSNNTQLENQKLQLINRLKLNERKVDEYQQQLRILNQDIEEYKQQNQNLTETLNKTSGYYKNKLEEVAGSKSPALATMALNQHQNNQNQQTSKRNKQLAKKVENLKTQNRGLRIYASKLKSLAEQYMPRGLEVPVSQPTQPEDINDAQQSQIARLNARIKSLQAQNRSRQPSKSQKSITNQRLQQQINFLKQSRVSTSTNADQLRKQRNQLKQQNRKLTAMLKDTNRLQVASVLKQNQTLKGEIDRLKSKDSVSPVSNDQKIVYYQKHIKKLQKQRSQLIVRVTMAQQQLKTYQNHFEKKK